MVHITASTHEIILQFHYKVKQMKLLHYFLNESSYKLHQVIFNMTNTLSLP